MASREVDRPLDDGITVPLLRDSHEHEHEELERQSKETPNSSLQARARLYWLAAVLCCGALLFGYDSGLIGTSDPEIQDDRILTRGRRRIDIPIIPLRLPLRCLRAPKRDNSQRHSRWNTTSRRPDRLFRHLARQQSVRQTNGNRGLLAHLLPRRGARTTQLALPPCVLYRPSHRRFGRGRILKRYSDLPL